MSRFPENPYESPKAALKSGGKALTTIGIVVFSILSVPFAGYASFVVAGVALQALPRSKTDWTHSPEIRRALSEMVLGNVGAIVWSGLCYYAYRSAVATRFETDRRESET